MNEKHNGQVRAKKFLGQHFLNDESIAEAIVNALHSYERVVEIGPGMGVLTRYLIQKAEKLTLIEIDAESVDYLKRHLNAAKVDIIQKDFLDVEMAGLPSPFSLIGNFPYNISTQILFKVLEHRDDVTEVVGMFQKEVAERIISPPGNKDYGILSVLLQVWFDGRYLFSVSPDKFTPPPKVQSGVISLVRNERNAMNCDEALFKRIVKQAFNQRRKTLRNSLRSFFPAGNFIYSDKRPEQLSWQQFEEIVNCYQLIVNRE